MNHKAAQLKLGVDVKEVPLPGIAPNFPVWVVKGHRDGWLKVQCPRSDCRQVTFVVEVEWLKPRVSGVKTRPCTYCFKAARHEGPKLEEVLVASSDGSRSYVVSKLDGVPTSCTCPGFTYRSACRHMTQA